MRRAYIEAHVPLRRAVQTALDWAAGNATIHVPDSSSVRDNEWIEGLGIPITSSSSKSRLHGPPRGIVIGFCLNLSEVLEVERSAGVGGIVVVQAHGPVRYAESAPSHAPWITAFDVEHLGGEEIARIPEASAPLKAAVNGLSGIAVVNQGLLDNRERSGAVQTLTYLRDHGVTLEPDGLMVEAMRNGWGGTGPEDLRKIAVDLNAGKALRFTKRITPERLEQWVQTK
ncbi:hypothetical protein L1080_036980 [Rhodococcus sp. MSC1_016]|jgi:hypothetical protein|uniref:hypothetical protein n=1 Tax=Rhodococcus sp. MSC1_016 TaxID=2909266 RepID=UPI002030EB8A|nr:hypothetical protein [Rhodococcus sp. MSC1_016]